MRVLLLAGGESTEREVSLNSGRSVFQALQELGHQVIAVDPATGKSLQDLSGKYVSEIVALQSIAHTNGKQLDILHEIIETYRDKIDIVFNTLHGGIGENGEIQCVLDLAGIRYTGAGMTASAVAMDKALTKRLFIGNGVPTPKWKQYQITNVNEISAAAEEVAEQLPFPVIVKPNDGGSTVGLTKVSLFSELSDAIAKAAKLTPNVLVEEFVQGRELTVTVFDGVAYPLVEISPLGGLYDYEAKYTKGKSEYFCPAAVPEPVAKKIQEAAVRAYHLIGARGLVRIDFLLGHSNEFVCLEINTLPGMTSLSLAPMAAKAVGIDFPQLIQKILDSALAES